MSRIRTLDRSRLGKILLLILLSVMPIPERSKIGVEISMAYSQNPNVTNCHFRRYWIPPDIGVGNLARRLTDTIRHKKTLYTYNQNIIFTIPLLNVINTLVLSILLSILLSFDKGC